MTRIHPQTVYSLTWAGCGHPEQTRYFTCHNVSDAWVRFSERLLALDSDPTVNGGYVHMKRLPDSIYPEGQHIAAWTKTSNERPTMPGFLTPEEAYWPPQRSAA